MRFFPILVISGLLLLPTFSQAAPSVDKEANPSRWDMYNGPIPFGAELFQGNFSKGTFDELNADYVIMPGDKIAVRLWGAHKFDGILDVDAAGNLFLPEVGPVRVAGVKHADLGKVVQAKLKSVFTNNVEIYTSLINTQPVAVFVTGFVASPGRYAGGPTDSVLYFLDQAGGIDPERGSFRDIRILRDGKLLTKVDLYPFLLEGTLPRPRLEEGDVILVEGRGIGVVADGQVRHKARFEFPPSFSVKGYQLQNLAVLLNNVSHASVVGSRNGAPFNIYLPLTDFPKMMLMDNDQVFFHADTPRTTIMVAAKGAIVGASRYPVKKDTRLLELLNYIPVEPELANLNGIHVLRKSVAERQKKALHEALARLEQSALTGTSQSAEEATIRVREAELITKFIEKARTVEPDGNLVVGHNGKLSDVYLEDSDVVVIPPKSDVVLISGEVMMPQAIVFRPGLDAGDFIDSAGGFSDRANKRQILVVKPNGEVLPASKNHIAAGDHIMVLPKFDSKNLQVFKDISQILYHIAVATKVAFDL